MAFHGHNNVVSDRNSSASPLLRLPPEIRSHIYEYALCNQNIHIGIRRCQLQDAGGYQRDFGGPIKLLHAVCLCSRTWREVYRISKQAEPDKDVNFGDGGHLDQEDESNPSLLRSFYTDHKICNSVLHDFQWQDYMSFLGKECLCAFPCVHYFQYRKDMINTYGDPPYGLSLKHAATKFNLALLQACRQIYQETALLPYRRNTFAFQRRVDMDIFLDTVLTREQRVAIERIHICIRSPINPTLPSNIPNGLKVLECYIADDEQDWWDGIEPWKHRFERIEVVRGWDSHRVGPENSRAARRERAIQFEKFLSKPQPEATSA